MNLDQHPSQPKFTFRNLKIEVQEFHWKFVLAPADKADNNADWRLKKMYYINTLKQELSTAKTRDHNVLYQRYVVDRQRCHMAAKICAFL